MKDALEEREYTQDTARRAPSRLAPARKKGTVRRVCTGVLAAAGIALLSFGAYGLFSKSQAAPPDAGDTPPQTAVSPAPAPAEPVTAPGKQDPPEPAVQEPAAQEPAEDPVVEPSPFTMEGLEDEAHNTLNDILKEGMTPLEKARAIFDFTHDSIRYTGDSDKSNWEAGAYEGLTVRRGDCFTYYAVSRALLTAAGIENLEVQRVGGPTSHYWNLVNCGNGWYHFDATPRSSKLPSFVSFMFTDQQAADYTAKAGRNYFTFDGSLYPERATGPCTDEPAEKPAESAAESSGAAAEPAAPAAAVPAGGENAPNGGAPEEGPPIIPADPGAADPAGQIVLG